nr:MAG TPA: hypothetical protein [Caudoviricetes sp.]
MPWLSVNKCCFYLVCVQQEINRKKNSAHRNPLDLRYLLRFTISNCPHLLRWIEHSKPSESLNSIYNITQIF